MIIPFYHISCFRIMGNMARPVNSMSMAHCLISSVSLVKSDTVWDTMFLDKVFIQCINGGFGSIANRYAVKANPYPISVIERKRNVAGVRGMDIWATSSCNLLVPSEHA